MENTFTRPSISEDAIEKAISEIRKSLKHRLDTKGYGTFASTHEITGVITEEYKELIEAQTANNQEDYKSELIDIAVGCIFGTACINEKGTQW